MDPSTEYRAVKVPLSFNVSVTGHRHLCNSKEYDSLVELVGYILGKLGKNCREQDSSVNLRLNSAIAAGADQIAAVAARKANENITVRSRQWALQVILPFERSSYQSLLYHGVTSDNTTHNNDKFDDLLNEATRVYELADRIAVIPKDDDSHSIEYWQNMRYRTLGEILARQADILLALWDGKAGGRGGTSDVVAMTLLQHKPVLRINPTTLEISWLLPGAETVDPIALADHPTWGPSAKLNDLFCDNGHITNLIKHLLVIPTDTTESVTHENTAEQSSLSTLPPTKESKKGSEHKQSAQKSNKKRMSMFSTATAFFGSSPSSKGAWVDKPQNSVAMEFENKLLTKLIKFRQFREFLAAKSFPEKTGATTYAIIYNKFVDFLTKKKLAKLLQKDNNSKPIPTNNDQSKIIKPQTLALRTDYAALDWEQHPYSSSNKNSESLSQAQTGSPLVIRNITDRPNLVNEIDDILRPAMTTTDAIATARGHTYRSSYILNFLGGTLAVWIGLAGLLFSKQKHFFVLAEVLLLLLLIFLYLISQKRSWHFRWLTTRYITESLRAGRYLIWIGFGGRKAISHDAPWGAWYANAVKSTCHITNAKMQAEDLRYIADELRSHVKYQINYHNDNQIKLHTLHHELDRWGKLCLGVTICVAVVFIACKLSPIADSVNWMKNPVTVVCAGLPALAGALMGIRFQGDYERFAERSKETSEQLQVIDSRLGTFVNRSSELSKQPLFEGLYRIVQDLSDIYERDLEDWRFVYSARPSPDAA